VKTNFPLHGVGLSIALVRLSTAPAAYRSVLRLVQNNAANSAVTGTRRHSWPKLNLGKGNAFSGMELFKHATAVIFMSNLTQSNTYQHLFHTMPIIGDERPDRRKERVGELLSSVSPLMG
jgi:hypothetical protein